MVTLPHKSKQYLLPALKVFILTVTFVYIYIKLSSRDGVDLATLIETVQRKGRPAIGNLIFFIGLTIANWTFEILKWRAVTSVVSPISINTAIKQSLSALTVSLATPNRIGEYGAKAYFFEPSKRKQILLLNFFSNLAQMSVTAVFGIVGIVYLILNNSISISPLKLTILALVLITLVILGYRFKEKELILKGLSIAKVFQYIHNLAVSIKIQVILFSVLRYVIFSFLFYQLLLFFGADITFESVIFIIASMYLLVSVIPTVFIFDVVIRGGVAVWLFSLIDIPEIIVLFTVLAMWLLNFLLPAILGSFYIISHKSKDQC